MSKGRQYRIVLLTCRTMSEARSIARKIVSERLAACANIVTSPVESIYRWKGKVEKSSEILLLVKTTAKRLLELENQVRCLHSYEVPEFIVLPISSGSREYLAWLGESCAPSRTRGAKAGKSP